MKLYPSGWAAVLVGVAGMLCQACAFEVAQDASNLTFTAGGKPVLTYRHAGFPFKPYAAQLWTPSGVAVLRDSPHDHKHHHALMFAVSAAGTGFWEETAKGGFQLVRRLESITDGLTQQLDWQTPATNIVLKETRTLKLHECPGATLLTWRSKLETPPGRDAVELTGHHYYGLGARFLQCMDGQGTFQNATGKLGEVVRGDERLVPARWASFSAATEGKTITFAIFDHPENPRHPNKLFSMAKPFGYLACTLNLWKEPLVLKAGAPLDLRYGVALLDGSADAAALEKLYRQWLGFQ
jgi:hypothetical protein